MFVNQIFPTFNLITLFGPFIFDVIMDMVKFRTCHLAICIISVDFSSNLAREGIFLCSLQMRKAGSGLLLTGTQAGLCRAWSSGELRMRGADLLGPNPSHMDSASATRGSAQGAQGGSRSCRGCGYRAYSLIILMRRCPHRCTCTIKLPRTKRAEPKGRGLACPPPGKSWFC